MQATATHKFKMKKKVRNETIFLIVFSTVPWLALWYFNVFTLNNLLWALGIGIVFTTSYIVLNVIARRNSQLYARIEKDNKTIAVWMKTKSPVWMDKLSIVRNTFNKDEFNAVTTQTINKNETLVISKKVGGSFYLPQRLGTQPAVVEFFTDFMENYKIDKKYKDIMVNFFNGELSEKANVVERPKSISDMLREAK